MRITRKIAERLELRDDATEHNTRKKTNSLKSKAMKKCYPIVHTINKSCEGFLMADIVSVYKEREQAETALENIADSIRNGQSKYFPNPCALPTITNDKPFGSCVKSITCEWVSDAQETMFSRFFVEEKNFID